VTKFLTIRGNVRDVSYTAELRGAEWKIHAMGLPVMTLAARGATFYQDLARPVIESAIDARLKTQDTAP
jgi:hypothetical protein